jgi:hypothetical protein
MHPRIWTSTLLASAAALAAAAGMTKPPAPAFTDDFDFDQCGMLMPDGGNQFFSLQPGHFLRLEGEDDGEELVVEITVLGHIRPIVFQEDGQWIMAIARVIEEREWADGELVEVSRNFFAFCPTTGDVVYLGEEVDDYEDGVIVGHGGAWLAGEDGALPGLIMPGRYLLGSRYFQEFAPDVALDRAEHVESGLTIETPAGVFHDCVRIVETSPLEPRSESIKIYAPGVGLIFDDGIELVEFDP